MFQQMTRGHAISSGEAEEAARARGFAGIGGLAGRQMARLGYDQGADRFKMQRSYDDALVELANMQTQAGEQKNWSMLEAQQLAAQEALQANMFTPAVLPTKNAAKKASVTNAMKKVAKKGKKR
jgi:hypothetical protein